LAHDSVASSDSEVGHSLQTITPSETDCNKTSNIAPFENGEWPLTISEYLDYCPNIWYRNKDDASLEVIPSPESDIDLAPSEGIPETALELITTFTVFPNLPLELRRHVWKAAIVPRLVHWRPGGGKPPGIMHACSESRAESFTVR
jgi:hypothetical protein